MENLNLIDRVHDMTAVEITAPAKWAENANLYGRTASELFPHDGGTRTAVIKDTKVPRYLIRVPVLLKWNPARKMPKGMIRIHK